MDKKRNIELENWLIETTGEEMMANHLGPNWNRFHEECGFYPNISMTIADQVWEHKQKQIDEINQENQKLVLSNTGYHNASASYLCKLMQIQFVLNQQTEIAKSKRTDGEVFEDKTETKIADYLDDYNIALDKILGDEATQEQFNAYAKGNEFLKQKARADKNQKQIDELQARLEKVKQLVQKWRDDPSCYSELNLWECSARIIQALKGGEV